METESKPEPMKKIPGAGAGQKWTDSATQILSLLIGVVLSPAQTCGDKLPVIMACQHP